MFVDLLWLPGMFLLIFFARLKIVGRENLKSVKGPLLFASNHTGELDGILILSSFSLFSKFIPLVFVSREPSFYNRTLLKRILFLRDSMVFKALGAYPAKVGLKDYSKSLAEHSKLLQSNHRVCIFPEGKIVDHNAPPHAKGGIGFLVADTHATVVPYYVEGASNVNWGSFFSRQHSITVRILPPLLATELLEKTHHIQPPDQYKEIANIIINTIYNNK